MSNEILILNFNKIFLTRIIMLQRLNSLNQSDGWETAYELHKLDLKRKSDTVILFVHWLLTVENDFSCVGLGNEAHTTPTETENITDILPAGWNNCNPYTIRYIILLNSPKSEHVLFNLIGFEYRNIFYIHLLQPKAENMATMVYAPSEIDEFINLINSNNTFILNQEHLIQETLINGAIQFYVIMIKKRCKEKEERKIQANKIPRSLRIY